MSRYRVTVDCTFANGHTTDVWVDLASRSLSSTLMVASLLIETRLLPAAVVGCVHAGHIPPRGPAPSFRVRCEEREGRA